MEALEQTVAQLKLDLLEDATKIVSAEVEAVKEISDRSPPGL